ncbi:hypothetical protein BMS3Abin07_01957 [bacterium BMS3Abin07]|nr:hypothetical protein BMS3Abin07_01957 [bacterium BMS3Abin07]GBE32402.1 hypothetical protein BMS3Bbin05_01317 [bacterium BMS3Bbin05]HDO21826.1 DUF4388 domain-containing protein [Nitrospirota bacterium]HDZ88699.1 DUF4388 domain-containing protein [Nitrospirota bacterium]
MALEGSIEEFGLADILQLLYFQKKTGLLTVEGRLGRVKIYFHSGNIVAAESKRGMEDKRLGKILLKKGIISEEKLQEAIEERKTSNEKIGAIFIKNGIVSKEEIQEIIINQLTDTVVQLFNWKKGTYEFKQQRIIMDQQLQISVDTQHLLMEGLRIIDELAVIEGKITLDTILRQTMKKDAVLSDEEKTYLSFIDGENDVSTIIEISDEEDIKVYRVILSLLEKGLIEPLEEEELVDKGKQQEIIGGFRIPVISLITNFLLIISFIISLNPFFIQKLNTKKINAEKDLVRIRLSIEIKKATSGSYPASLGVINTVKIDPWNNKYLYRISRTGYELRSSGPDGIPNTPDDIY